MGKTFEPPDVVCYGATRKGGTKIYQRGCPPVGSQPDFFEEEAGGGVVLAGGGRCARFFKNMKLRNKANLKTSETPCFTGVKWWFRG